MEISQKKMGFPLFKVTQGHWNRHRSIGYLWLPVSDPQ